MPEDEDSKKLDPDTNIVVIVEIEGLLSQVGEKLTEIKYDNPLQFYTLTGMKGQMIDLLKTNGPLHELRKAFEG